MRDTVIAIAVPVLLVVIYSVFARRADHPVELEVDGSLRLEVLPLARWCVHGAIGLLGLVLAGAAVFEPEAFRAQPWAFVILGSLVFVAGPYIMTHMAAVVLVTDEGLHRRSWRSEQKIAWTEIEELRYAGASSSLVFRGAGQKLAVNVWVRGLPELEKVCTAKLGKERIAKAFEVARRVSMRA